MIRKIEIQKVLTLKMVQFSLIRVMIKSIRMLFKIQLRNQTSPIELYKNQA